MADFRILTLDIETRPLQVYCWGLWQQNIGISQIIDPGGILCFAAKWHGEKEVIFSSVKDGEKAMLRKAHKLLDEADAVVGWNSQRFDTRWFNGQFVKHGLRKPSPYAQIDLMKSAKAFQYLPSYKLDFSARWLGIGQKVETGGFDLWKKCMDGDAKAWRTMEKYNKGDVRLTESVFDELRKGGWVKGLPNHSVDGGFCCPNCGGEKLKANGYRQTSTRAYKRWLCLSCGTSSQEAKSQPWSAQLKVVA